MRRFTLFVGLLVPVLAHAQPSTPGQTQPAAVHADRAWARATAPQQKVGGAYVTLTSMADDKLLGASSPVAGRVEVHSTTMDDAVMQMREMAGGVDLPAGQAVSLTPGGMHLMLMELRQPLMAGQTIEVQLRFQNAAPLNVQMHVERVGAPGPAAANGHTH